MGPRPKENQPVTKKNKIVNTIVNVILVVAIVFGVFCAFTAFTSSNGNGNKVPGILGFRFFVIKSESMSGTFEKGDLIVDFRVKDPSKLEVGDVITFWTIIQGERALNTHRITKIDDMGNYLSFTTKGDNVETNKEEDYCKVHQNEIQGKYLFHIPALGTFIEFLQSSKGFLLVIVLPVAIFFIWQIIQFFRALFAYQAEKIRLQYQAPGAALPQDPAPAPAIQDTQAQTPPASEPASDKPADEQ